MLSANEILENVVRLVNLLDDVALHEVEDLPRVRASQSDQFSPF